VLAALSRPRPPDPRLPVEQQLRFHRCRRRGALGDRRHTLEWRKHDIVSLPHGHWIGHTAETDDAWLCEVSDREMLKRLHILRDEFAD